MGNAPYTNIATAKPPTFVAASQPKYRPNPAATSMPSGTTSNAHAKVKESQLKTNCFTRTDVATRCDSSRTPRKSEINPRRFTSLSDEKSDCERHAPIQTPATNRKTRMDKYANREWMTRPRL